MCTWQGFRICVGSRSSETVHLTDSKSAQTIMYSESVHPAETPNLFIKNLIKICVLSKDYKYVHMARTQNLYTQEGFRNCAPIRFKICPTQQGVKKWAYSKDSESVHPARIQSCIDIQLVQCNPGRQNNQMFHILHNHMHSISHQLCK